MKFITTAPDRRTLVKAIAAHTGMEPSYIGPPTFNYTVGTITIDREGYVDVPDEQAAPALPPRARRPALRLARAAPAKTACAAHAEAHRRQCAAARLTPAQTARAVPAALRCAPKGGSNPWAVLAGGRGPLSCEFSQNSGVGEYHPKNQKQPPFFGRLFA